MLALGAAFGWGTSDFLGGLKSRSVPLLSVMLISQAIALALLMVITLVRGAAVPDAGTIGHAIAAGLAETAAVAALYRGLAVGTMSIVAPVAATAPVVPLLVGLASGEIPGPVQFGGLALATIGLMITSYRPNGTGVRPLPSILYGLVAAAGFGTFFVTMGEASEGDVGWALLSARLTAVVFIAALVVLRRHRPAVPRAHLPAIALIGVLMVTGDAMYAIATTVGLVSVAAVLGSLHTVVTIALARIVLKERLERPQQAGIVTTLAGVMAITAG